MQLMVHNAKDYVTKLSELKKRSILDLDLFDSDSSDGTQAYD